MVVAQLKAIAEATRGRIVWVAADPIQYAERAFDVALKPGTWPAFAIEDKANDFKFAFPKRGSVEDLSESAIRNIISQFLLGTLTGSKKSQATPKSQEGSVTIVVADNYDEYIIRSDKDKLLLYHSPACKHCRAMAPTYQKLGEVLKPYNHLITVAKLDATANDVSPQVNSFPTIKLFPSDSKDEPVVYSGNRTVEDLLKFIADKGSQRLISEMGNLVDTFNSKSSHNEL